MKIDNYSVRWRHFIEEGRTICVLEENEDKIGLGAAHLAECDQYNRSVGRKISLARALRDADIDKNDRTVIWDTLRTRGVKLNN